MPLNAATRARLSALIDATITPAHAERVRRTDNALTADGRVRGDQITGTIALPAIPALTADQVAVPGLDYDDLQALLDDLAAGIGSFLPIASPTFTGTLTGPTATITGTLNSQGSSNLGNGDADVTTLTGHRKAAGTTPGIAAGAAAGSSPTLAIAGTDTNGRISVTTGTATTTGTLFTITWASTWASSNYNFALTPFDPDAGGVMGKLDYARTTTTLVVSVAGSALAISTGHIWMYRVEEYP